MLAISVQVNRLYLTICSLYQMTAALAQHILLEDSKVGMVAFHPALPGGFQQLREAFAQLVQQGKGQHQQQRS